MTARVVASEDATNIDVDPSAPFKVLAVQFPLLPCESFRVRTVCPQVVREGVLEHAW